MKYSEYTVKDFASDKDFIKWVLSPTQDDEDKWNQWLLLNPHKKAEVEEAKRIVSLMQFKPIHLSEAKIENIKKNYQSAIQQSGKVKVLPLFSNYFVRIAASIAILISVSWLLYSNLDYFSAYKEVSTSNGQKIFVNLPDGSKVWLNGGSTIKYLKNLEENSTREVFLEGEAFFEVAKNPDKPFLVNASKMVIKVVGTSFNVRSYNDDETIETTLVEGKVLINTKGNNPHKNIALEPNQKAVFTKSSEQVELTKANTEASTSWRSGSLIIDNETFDAAIKKMERWYGTDIEIGKGGNCRISLKIEEESLSDVLELLQLTTKVKYKINKNKVLLEIDCDR